MSDLYSMLTTELDNLNQQRQLLDLKIENIKLQLKIHALEEAIKLVAEKEKPANQPVTREEEYNKYAGNHLTRDEYEDEMLQWPTKRNSFEEFDLDYFFFRDHKHEFLNLRVDGRSKDYINFYFMAEAFNSLAAQLLKKIHCEVTEEGHLAEFKDNRILKVHRKK